MTNLNIAVVAMIFSATFVALTLFSNNIVFESEFLIMPQFNLFFDFVCLFVDCTHVERIVTGHDSQLCCLAICNKC